ncbi:MAG: hypothetical protein AB4040_07245 [Synechococcus sp.]
MELDLLEKNTWDIGPLMLVLRQVLLTQHLSINGVSLVSNVMPASVGAERSLPETSPIETRSR